MSTPTPTFPQPSDVARAEAVLSSAIITKVAGPRPAQSRRWFGKTLFYTASLMTGMLLSVAGNKVLDKVGLLDELHGFRSPVSVIDSAPQQVKWLELQSSPFLEVGRNPDGTFSVHQMLQAWNDAGLEQKDVLPAIKLVNLLRPTLLGRADPLLEEQLTAEAKLAAWELARQYPQVLERLESGQNTFDAGWADKISHMAEQVSDLTPKPDWSLEAIVNQTLAWNQSMENVSPSSLLPIPELLKPGLVGGEFSVDALITAWRASGMDPGMVEEAIRLIKQALPVEDGLSEETQRTRNMGIDVMVARKDLSELFGEEIRRLSAVDLEAGFPAAPLDKGWRQQDWDSYWDEVRAEAHQGVSWDAPTPAPTMDEAMSALSSAVQETGLRSLSPSLAAWGSTEELVRTAQRLKAANAQLESITGWKGKVLGLDGRVELSMGSPLSVDGVSGLVAADETGRLQMSSTWSALGHEWFHAFEHVAARVVMVRSSSLPLSENMQPLRAVADPHVHGAMKALLATTDSEMPSWKSNRESARKYRGDYWVRPAEVLAFGFETSLIHVHRADALTDLKHSARLRLSEPERGPSQWEVESLSAPLQQLFSAAAPLGLAGTPPAIDPAHVQVSVAASVGEWREGRKAVAQAPLYPSVETLGRMRTLR